MYARPSDNKVHVGSITYLIEGYRVGIRWETDEIGRALEDLNVPNFVIDSGNADTTYSLRTWGTESAIYKDSEFDGVTNLSSLAMILERKIQLEVATHAPGAVFIHSGVVRWRDRALVLPGRTYTGKSSLTYALCRAGAEYYSDEYAIVGRDGRIRPWPRAITLRDRSSRKQISARELGWRPESGPIPASLILVSRYIEDTQWKPEPISAGQAMLSLLENTVTARTQPERALQYLKNMVKNAECLKADRGEAEITATLLLNYLDSKEVRNTNQFPLEQPASQLKKREPPPNR